DKADILSSGHKGWSSISLQEAGPYTTEAVLQHCLTHEVLCLKKATGLTSTHMLQILLSSPRLQSLITLAEGDYEEYNRLNNEYTHFEAKDFIDATTTTAEPSFDSFRPWACESTLKVFRAKIRGIPRPDITQTFSGRPIEEGMVLKEFYLGQSQEIQGQVHDRLARLIRLERRELGNEDRMLGCETRDRWDSEEEVAFDDEDFQLDCLVMSLQSGLGKLKGLKELRVLGVVRMATRIGPEEQQWMKEKWPKIEHLNLGGDGDVVYLK
ncbi:hypothetical protein BG015_005290, partial [Linnemannia schmuckeri]